MIRGIIFDYDGTLSNRFESAYRMYRWMIEEISGMDPSSIDFEEIVQECLYWDQYGHAGKGYVFNRLKETHFPDLDVEKCSRMWAEEFHRFQMPMEGSYEVLKKLKERYRLGILSNGDSVFSCTPVPAASSTSAAVSSCDVSASSDAVSDNYICKLSVKV